MGTGTIVDPFTLSEALASDSIKPGDTVIMRGGVYPVVSIRFPAGTRWQAYGGERPLITGVDGEASGVFLEAGVSLDSLWFGGNKQSEDKPILLLGDNAITGCTFWNYHGGIGEGAASGNEYRGNHFLHMGTDMLHHAIYISNRAERGRGATIADNLFLHGDGGYSVHLWHKPTNVAISHNFYGADARAMVIDGSGHVAHGNVIWSAGRATFYPTDCVATFSDNVLGANAGVRSTIEANVDVRRTRVIGGEPYGADSVAWAERDVLAHLGDSSANIDAAIAALDTAFQQTVAEIQADETIETHFATLRAVIDTWKATTE